MTNCLFNEIVREIVSVSVDGNCLISFWFKLQFRLYYYDTKLLRWYKFTIYLISTNIHNMCNWDCTYL